MYSVSIESNKWTDFDMAQMCAIAKKTQKTHKKGHFLLFSESHRFCDRVQDAYTLRCCPQVHGVSHDTIDFVRGIITTEMNSGTDNPVSTLF